jgi:glutathione S-transferase
MGLQHDLNGAEAIAARAGAAAFCVGIEQHLAGRQYLDDDFGFADIAFYMAQLFGERMGAPLDQSTPNLLAWRARLTARPTIGAVVGSIVSFLAVNGRDIPAFVAQLRPA